MKKKNMNNLSDYKYPEFNEDFEGMVPVSGSGSGGGGGGDNRFIVTCTPTARDYSGTMDKTVEEIDIAHENGKSVEFVLPGVAAVPLSAVKWVQTGSDYASVFAAQATNTDSNMMIELYTDSLSISKIYHTKIYQLTPMVD